MTMRLSLRRSKSRNKRFNEMGEEAPLPKKDGKDDEFEELLERIGDEEFLIEKLVEKVSNCWVLGGS